MPRACGAGARRPARTSSNSAWRWNLIVSIADAQLGRELAVRRRRGEARLRVGAAERDKHAALRGAHAQAACGSRPTAVLPPPARDGRDEGENGMPDREHVAVAQRPAAVDPLAVDERAVARAAVVDERPDIADALDRGVRARDLVVPGQRDVAAGWRPIVSGERSAVSSTIRWRCRRRGAGGTGCRAARPRGAARARRGTNGGARSTPVNLRSEVDPRQRALAHARNPDVTSTRGDAVRVGRDAQRLAAVRRSWAELDEAVVGVARHEDAAVRDDQLLGAWAATV